MTKAELLAARANPNVQTLLNLIAETEGTTKNGYATKFGGGLLTSLTDHPRELHAFGKDQKTSAAGRYQFLQSTWDEEAKALGLTDFGPLSQDLAAIDRIAKRGALDDVLKGNFDVAIGKLGKEWASLPSSPYAQPKRSESFVQRKLAELTGQTLPSAPTVTASQAPAENVVSSLLSMAALTSRDAMKPTLTGFTTPPTTTAPTPDLQDAVLAASQPAAWWNQEAMQQAADEDVETLRQEAVSKFFNEPTAPRIQIPPQIDTLINRYLSQL